MTTANKTQIPAFTFFVRPCDLTAADLRSMADLLDLVGQTVRFDDGHFAIVGTLTKVYWTDGPAVNIVGPSGDFYYGPLDGVPVTPVS